MCTRAFARFNRVQLSAPLVEASPGHPELLGQFIDAYTGPHALYGHALKLPGISLSSLHSRFLSRRVCPSRVCQFKGSFQIWENLEAVTYSMSALGCQWTKTRDVRTLQTITFNGAVPGSQSASRSWKPSSSPAEREPCRPF